MRGAPGGASLYMRFHDDMDQLATDLELTDQQRQQLSTLVEGFTNEHGAALERMRTMRDSMMDMGSMRERPGSAERREMATQMRDAMDELMPAFREFDESVADVLTWKQGQMLSRNSRPAMRGARGGMGPRGFMPRRGMRGRMDMRRGSRRGPWEG